MAAGVRRDKDSVASAYMGLTEWKEERAREGMPRGRPRDLVGL